MIARGIALCVSLACCTVAMGGAEVVLECVDNPATCNPGPGGTETINVYLRQDPVGSSQLLRFVQFDFTDTPADLTISLPVSHLFPTGEISPSGDMHFWDFGSTNSCQLAAENCGFGHVVDDELPGALPPGPDVIHITYLGDLSNPLAPDLGPNVNNQWLLPGDGSNKLIGQLQVTCPASGARTLDLLNADESDAALGARIDYGFEPRVTWRARAGSITGGTIQVCGGVEAVLTEAVPPCDGSIWRNANNTIRLTFDAAITAPAPGEIEIRQLMAGGALGADMSSSFTYTVEPGNVLRIRENGTALTNKTWYGILNTGGWSGVAPFEVDYALLVGDFSGDKRVLSADVLSINAEVPCLSGCGDDRRADINGDGRILSADVLAANAQVPVLSLPKPDGHGCNP